MVPAEGEDRVTPDQVTTESLRGVLQDPAARGRLLAAMRAERGSHLPLSNRVDAAARNCVATAAELDELVDILLAEDDHEYVLCPLAFHPIMPEAALVRMVDAGRALAPLAHRAGPESLLLRLAQEHRRECEEAVLTLALHTYAPPEVSEERFLSFVREHIDLYWLRESLRVADAADRLSGNKRAAALRLVEEYETAQMTGTA